MFLNLFENDNIEIGPSDTVQISNDTFSMLSPVKKIVITSPFGNRIHPITKTKQFHNGIDLSGKMGDNIYASDNGYVVDIFYNNIGGNQVSIKYNNYTFGYAHMNEIFIRKGDPVRKYQVIGKIGNSGRSTGPHLHLTIKNSNGEYLNPEKIIKTE
jgi:murein DD-endopeptidase MepM/ murein hydrolase activator NlpD